MLQRALPGAPHMAHTAKQTHTRGQRHTRSPANKNIPLARFLSRRSPAHTRYLCLSGSWGVAATLISRRTTRKWCVCACVIWHKKQQACSRALLSLYISISLSYIYSLSLRQHGDTAAVFSIYTDWTAEDCAAHPEIWFLMSEKKSSLLFQSYMYFNIHLLFSNNWFALYSNHSLSWGGSSLHTVQIRKIFWLEEKDLGMFVVLIKIRA